MFLFFRTHKNNILSHVARITRQSKQKNCVAEPADICDKSLRP